MMNSDLISIIVPLYNSEKYIHETILSVVNQTYPNWELIIIDDCSSDNSLNIVKKIMQNDKRVKLITNDVNFGSAAKPRNIGIRHAKGQYIAFLDSDDVWDKNKLQEQLEYMRSTGSTISCTDLTEIDRTGNINPRKNKLFKIIFSILPSYSLSLLLITNRVCTSSVMLKRSLLNGLLFDEDKKIAPVEDYHLWLSILLSNRAKKIDRLKKNLVMYRVHDENISSDYSEMLSKAKYCRAKATSEYEYKMPRWLTYLSK